MVISNEELRRRKNFLGSSDIAMLFGLSRYGNMGDLYLDKTTASVEEEEPDDDCKAVGTYLEGAILDWAEKRLGHPIVRNGRFQRGRFAANLDGLILDEDRRPLWVVEGKTSSEPWKWGPSGTDEIPDEYMMQVQEQMLVTQTDRAYVAVLITGFAAEFRLYTIERDEDLIEMIEKAAAFFWEHVDTTTQPEDVPRIETITKVQRVPNKTVEMPRPDFVTAFEHHHKIFLDTKKRDAELRAAVLSQLGDAECGTFDGGRVEYFGKERGGYEVKPGITRRMKIVREEEGE
jgi:putative phage-type endonuclease